LAAVVATIGIHPIRAPDSPSYLKIDLLGRSPRLWTVPIIFRCLPNDAWRVGAQTAIFIGAWVLCARTVGGMVKNPVLRAFALVAILCLGLGAIDWNVIILSESLASSFTVIVLATWIRLDHRPSTARGVAFILAAVGWTFTRQVHVLVIVPLALLLAVSSIRRRGSPRWVAGALAAVAIWGVCTVAFGHGDRSIQRYNSMAILADRILPDARASAFFRSHGLQVTGEDQELAGDFSDHPSVFLDDQPLVDWVDRHFLATYASYLATNPVRAIPAAARGVSELPPTVEFGLTKLAPLSGVWRAVWGVGSLLVLGALAAATTGAAAIQRRWRPTTLLVAGCAGVVLAWWWLLVVWLLSATELGRLSVPANLLLRVALIAVTVQSADVLFDVGAPVLRPHQALSAAVGAPWRDD
jgi:hypothetical protein